LGVEMDEAASFVENYYAQFPKLKNFLAAQVDRAKVDGFTTTMFGRRRYLPELQSANFRLRALGERMALNAPIQGSAADILKKAMIGVDRALRRGAALRPRGGRAQRGELGRGARLSAGGRFEAARRISYRSARALLVCFGNNWRVYAATRAWLGSHFLRSGFDSGEALPRRHVGSAELQPAPCPLRQPHPPAALLSGVQR